MIYRDSVGMNKARIAKAAALAIAIAIPSEGLRQWAYEDIANPKLLTVCYGSTTAVEKGKHYSLEECKARLDIDMLHALNAVEACHPGLPTPILAAFADAVFNIGPTVACNSTASKYLDQGRYADACRQLPRWNKARVAGAMVELPGLTNRRKKEMELCLSAS